MGWKSKIQSIVTEVDLLEWYEKGLRGTFSDSLGDAILQKLANEIQVEFPTTDKREFLQFIEKRGYDKLINNIWI
jgi:membrane-bound lytic murein transglycosylase MltF